MSFLYEEFDTLSKYGNIKKDIPDFVARNLGERFSLREYQKEAIGRLIFYTTDFQARKKPAQLLFHMATGSGKTLIMAADILYLYKRGYRNFIFFVNSTNIIKKTKENFLNPRSLKYLFAEKIIFGDKEIKINEVNNFEISAKDDINILFTTIQGLHSRLHTPREDAVTFEDFQDKKIILISDEAHHLNTLTKNLDKLGPKEREEVKTWECTVNKILNADKDNILLEFTATIPLDNPNVAEKYKNKILYQYSLKEFRKDKYSKEVKVLQAELPPMERALQAMVISQYRRKVAEKHGLLIKPVVLMKSKNIEPSQMFRRKFHEKIRSLRVKDLENIRRRAKSAEDSSIIKKAFDFFDNSKIKLGDLVRELKDDFSAERSLSVNDKTESEQNQILVNTLEDQENGIRVVFAVDKLNEGWDVLNLFDIVRLYETRDSKHGKPGKTTIAEAQLIGRGARYYPFTVSEGQIKDKRKYDDDSENELRSLEELHYHSLRESKYISELTKALVDTGIMPDPERTRTVDVRIKDSFKKTDFWKNGLIFLNKRQKYNRKSVFGLDDAKIKMKYDYRLMSGGSVESRVFDGGEQTMRELSSKIVKLGDFGDGVLRKAMNKLLFFEFDNLQKYFPNLGSVKDFILSPKFLAGIEVNISGEQKDIWILNQEQKLDIAVSVLGRLAREIQHGITDYIGTKKFESHAIKNKARDKKLKIIFDEYSDKEYGREIGETQNEDLYLNIGDKDWYIYDKNYGTSEEKYLIKFIYNAMRDLKKKYKDIYLLRNERLFKLYRFSNGDAMEPDFVLFLRKPKAKESIAYQLFIEPKGEYLALADKWKEDFLKEIENEYELETVFENDKFKLVGMPFYNEGNREEFEEKFKEIISV